MKKIILWAVVCFLTASGCGTDPYARFDLGPAHPVVAGCIEAIGGVERWQSVESIHATAVVTTYDAAGEAMVNRQQHIIYPGRDVIRASARTAQGKWTAEVGPGGKSRFRLTKSLAVSDERKKCLIAALRTILHRVRGPLNLCRGGEKVIGSGRVRVGAMKLIRVPVTGGTADVKAYYFDAQTCALRLVTAGADAPGGRGTVTIYSYRIMPNGMAFPVRISVMKIGEHTLIGDRPALEVNYREVSF